MSELIVDFRAGVSEDTARAVMARAGATVRRRMRNDDPSLVRLLARLPAPEADAIAAISGAPEVARVEANRGDYGIR